MNRNYLNKPIANHDGSRASDAVVVAKQLAELEHLRREAFKAYPEMDHIPVKILVHIFLEQAGLDWAATNEIPDAVCIGAKSVQRYLHYLCSVGLAEVGLNATGQIDRARLSVDADAVVSCYLRAIAELLSPRDEDHQ